MEEDFSMKNHSSGLLRCGPSTSSVVTKGGNRCTITWATTTITTMKHALIAKRLRLRLGYGCYLGPRPRHGDKIKLNCFMTGLDRLARRPLHLGFGLCSPWMPGWMGIESKSNLESQTAAASKSGIKNTKTLDIF